ncbi:UNVERIFIED_ORG: hypothetical protein ABIB19_002214 [Arthrobacter sp. UYEF10]
MRSLPLLASTVLAAAVVLLASACSVTVPESGAPEVGVLLVSDPAGVPGQAGLPTTARTSAPDAGS